MKPILAVLFAVVAACGGNPAPTSDNKPGFPGTNGANVAGRVVNRFGEPVSGARVRIGAAAVVTTDTQGKFTVAAAPASYDAAVEVDDPTVPPGGPSFIGRAVVYQGLTRADPVLLVPGLSLPPSGSVLHSQTVQSINITDQPAGDQPLLWAFTNPIGFVATGRFGGAMFFLWDGPPSGLNIGTIAVLVGSGSHISASGSTPATAGLGPLTPTVQVTATQAYQISGNTRAPAGCALDTREVVVPATDGTALAVATIAQAGTPPAFAIDLGFPIEVPLALRVPVTCLPASSTSVVFRRLSLSKTAFDLDVPAPPSITATGATATLTTPLTWTAPAGVSVVHFDRRDSTGLVVGTLDVAAASTSVTFPDLTALGAQVLPGSALEWHVETWGGVTSTDALAAATGFGALLAGTVDFTHGVSDSSTVTISR